MKNRLQMAHVTVICANISDLLLKMNSAGIGLYHVCIQNEITASFYILQHEYHLSEEIIKREGGRIASCVPASLTHILKEILNRPVLILGCVLILFLSFFLPTKILFVQVSGNEHLATGRILEAASNCGVAFGAERHEIRSEKVKNNLLAELPELKWVGVNTSGCVARISVQERALMTKDSTQGGVSSIMASCDGVIRDLTVRRGSPVCHVGQAVKKGQLLVSGYSDCGRCIYGTQADAEIFAQTNRVLQISTLTQGLNREYTTGTRTKIGLIVGKKRINFYKGSGISDTSCVRMYMEYPLTLPGGFQLPVSLTFQEEAVCESEQIITDASKAETVILHSAKTYLESQMIAGRIIHEEHQTTVLDGAVHMLGQYTCDEMIAQTRNEEIVYNYEQTD